MSTIEKLYLFGSGNIKATKTGMIMHVIPDTTFELSPKEVQSLRNVPPYTREFKEHISKLFLEKIAERFISEIRTDVNLKRSIGGTKWEPRYQNDIPNASIHLCREDILTYHTRLVEACLDGKHGGEKNVVNHNIESILDALERA